jgi:hypothetical protein
MAAQETTAVRDETPSRVDPRRGSNDRTQTVTGDTFNALVLEGEGHVWRDSPPRHDSALQPPPG